MVRLQRNDMPHHFKPGSSLRSTDFLQVSDLHVIKIAGRPFLSGYKELVDVPHFMRPNIMERYGRG